MQIEIFSYFWWHRNAFAILRHWFSDGLTFQLCDTRQSPLWYSRDHSETCYRTLQSFAVSVDGPQRMMAWLADKHHRPFKDRQASLDHCESEGSAMFLTLVQNVSIRQMKDRAIICRRMIRTSLTSSNRAAFGLGLIDFTLDWDLLQDWYTATYAHPVIQWIIERLKTSCAVF